MSEHQLTVGKRLRVGKHVATIRYIGQVQGQQGEWVGLEWDDPSRGKHDGSHDGTRYFSCARHQSSGSFLRLPKLLETAYFGQSLSDAIQERYKDNHKVSKNIASISSQKGTVAVELVGAEEATAHVSEDGVLLHASFLSMSISSLDITLQVQSFLSQIQILDLSCNLLSHAPPIFQLASALPHLHTLDLSGNIIGLDTFHHHSNNNNNTTTNKSGTIYEWKSLDSLQTLILNNCYVSWPHVVSLCQQLPRLKQLYLSGNNIKSLQWRCLLPRDTHTDDSIDATQQIKNIENTFQSLQVLDLADNSLDSWSDIEELKHLPSLTSLLLGNNKLSSIAYSTTATSTGTYGSTDASTNSIRTSRNTATMTPVGAKLDRNISFASLQRLALGKNHLASWESIDQLNLFPALHDVRVSDNPLTHHDPSAARYAVIARCGKLTTCNGSFVKPGERRDAELAYLRKITDEITVFQSKNNGVKGGDDDACPVSIKYMHPRYDELHGKYGPLAMASSVSKNRIGGSMGTSLSSTMVELTFVGGKKELKKKVPVTLTVGRLKVLLEKLLKIRISHQHIFLIAPDNGNQDNISNDDSKELKYFNVSSSGWKVQVTEACLEDREKARHAAVEMNELKLEQHEAALQMLRREEERIYI